MEAITSRLEATASRLEAMWVCHIILFEFGHPGIVAGPHCGRDGLCGGCRRGAAEAESTSRNDLQSSGFGESWQAPLEAGSSVEMARGESIWVGVSALQEMHIL